MKSRYKRTHSIFILLLVFLLVGGLLPASKTAALAVTPKITVAPVWRPTLQLTTIDAAPFGIWNPGDDIRYAELDIMVTTTVEFWAFDLTCTVNKTLLEGYTQNVDDDADPNTWEDSHDDSSPVWWGDLWSYNGGSALIPSGDPGQALPFDPATGKVNIAAARQGTATTIGQNGAENTYRLATLRFRVKSAAGTSPLACTSAFLDRNGKPVLAPTFQAPAPLQVSSGYTIAGTATYQVFTSHNGITVRCFPNDDPGDFVETSTGAYGSFVLSNVRRLAHYHCTFYGNITDPSPGQQNDIYVASGVDFPLWEQGYRLLPIELRLGNLEFFADVPPGENQRIREGDLALVTGNWNATGTTGTTGDANLDGKTDKSDLAIVAGNWDSYEEVWAGHVIYGLARVSEPFFDNRVWRGNEQSGPVVQQIPNAGTAQYYWPTLSYDGASIAYIRSNGQANPDLRTYELYKYNTVTNVPTRVIARNLIGNREAFAPSWSPDNTRIAFVCSRGTDYKVNEAQLCIVDADGRNFHVLDTGQFGPIHVYPPTWDGNGAVIYGCGETLCWADVNNNWRTVWDEDLPGAGIVPGRADMPVRTHEFLLYRYTAPTGERRLRIAELEWIPNELPNIRAWSAWQQPPASRPDFAHTDVFAWDDWAGSFQPAGWEDLDYFNASRTNGVNVMYYQLGYDMAFFNIDFDWDAYYNGNVDGVPTCAAPGCYPRWFGPQWHPVDGQRGGPAWDGDLTTPTFRHALRTTADRVP